MMVPGATLGRVLGQDTAKDFLRRALRRDRLSHAYLFKGPAGVGKKTMARAVAALLNCRTPVEEDACGVCPSCVKMAAGTHPDFLLMEPEADGGAIKIDQVRDLRKKIGFAPFEAAFRVVLFPDIHQTLRRREVANSLLKTLEEPPPRTVFVLTGEDAGGILPTILSRCQRVPFYPLPVPLVAAHLCQAHGLAEQEARSLALLAEGSLGRASLYAGNGFLALRREVVETILRHRIDEAGCVEAVFALSEKMVDLDDDLPEFLDLVKAWFRDLCATVGHPPASHESGGLQAMGLARFSPERVVEMVELFDQAKRQLLHNCSRVLVCEILLFKLVEG